jgi:hypothetical protein
VRYLLPFVLTVIICTLSCRARHISRLSLSNTFSITLDLVDENKYLLYKSYVNPNSTIPSNFSDGLYTIMGQNIFLIPRSNLLPKKTICIRNAKNINAGVRLISKKNYLPYYIFAGDSVIKVNTAIKEINQYIGNRLLIGKNNNLFVTLDIRDSFDYFVCPTEYGSRSNLFNEPMNGVFINDNINIFFKDSVLVLRRDSTVKGIKRFKQ